MVKGLNNSIWLKLAPLFCIVSAIVLDIVYADYPKVGHVVGFVIGLVIRFIICQNLKYYLGVISLRRIW